MKQPLAEQRGEAGVGERHEHTGGWMLVGSKIRSTITFDAIVPLTALTVTFLLW
ncbi:MAG: hypothetical protein JO352_23910 [Chloroflexi bacterium]|nr:hypothetical protein [Chloroflexota bacterium]